MSLPDLALAHLLGLIETLALPTSLLILAAWKVARLRDLTEDTYAVKVETSVADTFKREIGNKYITPLFQEMDLIFPPGATGYDIINEFAPHENVTVLTEVLTSLEEYGLGSPFMGEFLKIALTTGF